MGLCLVITSICSFASPLGINKVLEYLETDGENATIKPWLWIFIIFLGAIIRSTAEHWNLYLQTVVLVRIQALLTQLVFEHSLRIRLKAEASGSEDKAATSGTSTPKTVDTAEESSRAATPSPDLEHESSDGERDGHQARDENETQSTSTVVGPSRDASQATLTPASRSGSVKGKSKADTKGVQTPAEDPKKKSKDAENLLGRINNLVTSDLDAIVDGTTFLTFGKFLSKQ